MLREMIKSPGVIDSPGIHDPLTARIAESVGFGCVNLSGPGLGVVTCEVEAALGLDDLAEATHRITNTIKIPLLVDAGGGFGEPAHVFHTVRVLEHAGAAGLRRPSRGAAEGAVEAVGIRPELHPCERAEGRGGAAGLFCPAHREIPQRARSSPGGMG